MSMNSVELLQKLLQYKTITPQDVGCQTELANWLESLGFKIQHIKLGNVHNFYATRGDSGKHLLFAGHTDVVPANDENLWICPAFSGSILNERIYGRGAQDMKGAIASFVAAISKINPELGKISLLITGDEEGEAINGTEPVLEILAKQGEKWDGAIVGEPTCKSILGDTIKIGRRGSLNGRIIAKGKSGHIAYPHLADNAISKILPYLIKLDNLNLDQGNEKFAASNLEITQIVAGSQSRNVIANDAYADFNIRFNNIWSRESLKRYIIKQLNPLDVEIIWLKTGGESFLTQVSFLSDSLTQAIKEVLNIDAGLDTNGGTSDARFVKKYCPVIDFGLCGDLMHQINESVPIAELENLTNIYKKFIEIFFK